MTRIKKPKEKKDRHVLYLEKRKEKGKRKNHRRQTTYYLPLRDTPIERGHSDTSKDTMGKQVWLPDGFAHAAQRA